MLFGLLITAAVQDIRSGKVSNRLIVAGLMIGAVFQMTEHGIWGIYFYLRNISVPVILLYLLFQMRVLGAGDIKLFSMIGSILTIEELCRCMMYGFIAGGIMAFLFLAIDKRRWERLKYGGKYLFDMAINRQIRPYHPPMMEESVSFPFAVPILFGVIGALYFPVSL